MSKFTIRYLKPHTIIPHLVFKYIEPHLEHNVSYPGRAVYVEPHRWQMLHHNCYIWYTLSPRLHLPITPL
jgi:hypothetical protein